MRVLALVTDAFGGYGGISQYNRDFLSALRTHPRIEEVAVLPRQVPLPLDQPPAGIRQLAPVHGRIAYSTAALTAVARYWPIDVVFCGHLFLAPLASLLAKLTGAKLWIQVHGIEAWYELNWLHRRALARATLVTSVSRYTRRMLLRWSDIDPCRVRVLPNTVDPRFTPGPKDNALLDRYGLWGKKVLLTTARLAASEQQKGHDRVIRALPRVLLQHPETIYLIVGDGDDRPRLEALAEKVGVADKVCFAGLVSPEELPAYYRLSDVFVMPSTCEGFGIAFVEAIASGLTVIGGNRDGSPDPLRDGRGGLLLDPFDGDKLAEAISAALTTKEAANSHAEVFNRTTFSKHVHALLETCL